MTTVEAAAKLGVTRARVRQLILAGRIPVERLGARPLLWIEPEALDAFMRIPRRPGRPKLVKPDTTNN